MTTIKDFTHRDLDIRMDVKNVILSALLLVLGLVVTVYALRYNSGDENSSSVMLGIGILSAIAGVVCYIMCGKELYFLPTNSKVEVRSLHYDVEHFAALRNLALTGKYEGASPLVAKQIGNVRLDIMKAEDNTFAAIQVSQYTDLMYAPVADVRVLNVGEVEALVEHLKM